MTDRELMLMALEELESLADVGYGDKGVIQTLRDRLAQSEPPDVMWLTFHEPPMVFRNRDDALAFCQDGEQPIPMYSSPQSYDQAALELCDVCGWKAVVPDECCLNCKRLAQPEPWVKTYCGGKPNYTTQPELGEPWDSMPVAFINIDGELSYIKSANTDKELYTAPPKREWVGLTDEEVNEIYIKNIANANDFVRVAEAKLKDKNGG